MDIQEFIRESLVQIAVGIKEANTTLKEKTGMKHQHFKMEASVRAEGRRGVEFDIAVVAREEVGAKGGAKLGIPLISIGGDVGTKTSSENVSRMKFNVAVDFDFS